MTSNDEDNETTDDNTQIDDLIDRVDSIATDPLRRLAVAVTVRDDMTETGEAVLDHFVGGAREAGHSWAEIGDVLGVTRQAAQQRAAGPGATRQMLMDLDPPAPGWGHGWGHEGKRRGKRRPGGGRGRGGGRGHLFRHMSDEARDTFRHARTEAADFGDRRVTTLHLLDALYEGGHATAFERVGVTRDRVRAVLDERRSDGAERVDDDRWNNRPRMSPPARRAMEAALKHAMGHEADHVTPRHLALGLLHGEGRVAALLDEVEADRDTVRSELAEG